MMNRTVETFIGPSVEGKDQEYEKVLSGEVERRKPSFVYYKTIDKENIYNNPWC